MVIITKNTYPEHPNVPHGNVGDICEWELSHGCFNLVRLTDKRTVFSTAPVNKEGLLRSNNKQPVLVGKIASYIGHEIIVERVKTS